ncbi:MAG: prolyl-tRNA synthetase associated domain-containing protein [Micavibrio aeruginosavorus]|uniref:Prolyl-tRNA synthetase associated domain-containing protein n=1 Tax=Micavibrio aeruginosavorus TaxID=349221 RepID=A0A7T5UIU3_9BACT|nr:MAG: prolyl-tRNA synthetase associated domain-containing protein [Micavibrio aeruginosavorus]
MTLETPPESQIDWPPLPTPAGALFAILADLGISYVLYHHRPVFTVEESLDIERGMPGAHCRNLFVRDKKGAMFLVVARNETAIDLKKLADMLSCGRLSFGSPDRLWAYLGVRPGSVCPFAIVNDRARQVRIVLDRSMMDYETVNYHPMENHMTIGLSPRDLLTYIRHADHEPQILDLTPAAPDESEN